MFELFFIVHIFCVFLLVLCINCSTCVVLDTRRGQKVEAEPGSESFQEIYRAARSSYLDPNKPSRWEICEITLLQNDELGLDFHGRYS